jgi:hypothetical protein
MTEKWRKGEQIELPDDEPLSAEDLADMEYQRNRSQSALINRAAAQGMTPMELFASGQVTAHAPDDALAFDKSRQLPAAEERQAISEDVEESDVTLFIRESEDGPWQPVGTVEPGDFKLSVDGALTNTERIVIKSQERPTTEFQGRIDEWMAKDQGRSFMEGFNSYFDAGSGAYDATAVLKGRQYDKELQGDTPRAGEEPVVPREVTEDEVAEGEIVPDVKDVKDILARANQRIDDDIVDAEVVEDD